MELLYYGVMIPADTRKGLLKGYDKVWSDAVKNENFKTFATGKGLTVLNADRNNSGKTATKMAKLQRILA